MPGRDADGPTSNATIGSQTVLNNADEVGVISFGGSGGVNHHEMAAIQCFADGTLGDGDTPGRLVFSTTLDTASTVTERLRITNTGRMVHTLGQVAHFWVYWTANSTTILASHNVSSIDDDNTADAGVNLTTGFSTNNFAAFVQTNDATDGWDSEQLSSCGINVHTASVVDVLCTTITEGTTSTTNPVDPEQWQVMGFGVSA